MSTQAATTASVQPADADSGSGENGDQGTQPDSQNPTQSTGDKRVSEVTPPDAKKAKAKPAPTKRTKPVTEFTSYYKSYHALKVTPSVSGLLDVISDVVTYWYRDLKRAKIEEVDARATLLYLVRFCIKGYITAVNIKEYPGMFYEAKEREVELPPLLAFLIGRLRPYKREHYPDLVLDVPMFIQNFDTAVRQRGWHIANSVVALRDTDYLMRTVGKEKHVQWLLPVKATAEKSILPTGVCLQGVLPPHEGGPSPDDYNSLTGDDGRPIPPPKVYSVSVTGGSRKMELIVGRMRLRYFDYEMGFYTPHVLRRESQTYAALCSYTASSRPWTMDDYMTEVVGPIMSGTRTVSGAGSV